MPYYPRFVDSARQWLSEHPDREQLTEKQLEDADERFFEINQLFYQERDLVEAGDYHLTMDEVRFRHTILMQEFFDDTFGEDAWEDRHEIYVAAET